MHSFDYVILKLMVCEAADSPLTRFTSLEGLLSDFARDVRETLQP